jgi:hypothetical protein
MPSLQTGKLLIYASTFASHDRRLKPLSMAAEKIACQLKMNVEVKKFAKRFTPIYVYYKQGDEDPVPLYWDNDETSDSEDVYEALKNMMFVLSFHPRNSALRQARKEIRQLS